MPSRSRRPIVIDRQRDSLPRPLEWTAGRSVPWGPDVRAIYEHLHRYLWASRIVDGRRVLDLGSGAGYGSAILAETAAHVIGLDVDEPAAAHGRRDCAGAGNLEFRVGSASDLSDFADGSFDVVVALEVIEHVSDQRELLGQIARVLTDDGALILSTPERRVDSEVPGNDSPFYLRELTLDELSELLTCEFGNIALWVQHVITGSAMTVIDVPGAAPVAGPAPQFFVQRSGDEWITTSVPARAHLVAGASNGPLPRLGDSSTLADVGLELVRESERDAASLRVATDALRTQLDFVRAALEASERRARDADATLDAEIPRLQETITVERARSADLLAQLLALGDETGELRRELLALGDRLIVAEQVVRRVDESVTWRALQRLRSPLYRLLGGDRSGLGRAFGVAMRGLGSLPFLRPGPSLQAANGASALRGQAAAVVSEAREPFESPLATGAAHVVFPVFEEPSVSLIVPLYSGAELTRACLESIRDHTAGVSYEVLLVDDNADAETKQLLTLVRGATIIVNDQNLGYLYSINRGATAARGRWLVLCNNDIQVEPDWLRALKRCGESRSDIGVVTPKYVYADGTLNEAGGIIWSDGTGVNYGRGDDPCQPAYNYRRQVDYGSAAALMVRADLFADLGGYDARYTPMYYEDTDLCFEVRRRGLRVMYEPEAVVVHREGGTAGIDPELGHKRHQERNRVTFASKWSDVLHSEHPRPRDGNHRGAADRLATGHVLMIDSQVPMWDRDSGSLRMMGMIRSVQKLGFQVTFVPDNFLPAEPYTRQLQRIGVEVLRTPLEVESELQARGPTLRAVVLSRPTVGARWLPMVRELAPAATLIYDTVDLHWIRESRGQAVARSSAALKAAKVSALRELELAMVRATDVTLVVTDVERRTLESEVAGARVLVVPNLHQIAERVPPPAGRSGIVFVGGFGHPPNTDAARQLVEVIMPEVWRRLPDVPVTIVGADPPPEVRSLERPFVEVAGWVEDVEAVLHAARLMVAPLRFGAGMKGKVTQSLALGLPVATTSIGAEGLETGEDSGLLVAEDPVELAEKIVAAYTDDELWQHLSRCGQSAVARTCAPAVAYDVFGRLLCDRASDPAHAAAV